MLSYLRHKTIQRILFLALCVLVIPGFVFLSISHDSSAANGTAGTLGNRKIKVQEYVRNFEAMRRELEIFGGVDLSKLNSSVDLETLAWQRILLVQGAKEAGIRVSDEEIIAWIQEQPVFQENGVFSEERYKLLLDRYLKIDAKRFEDESREYLSLQRYRDQIRGTYQPTDAELRERFHLLYGPRQLEYVLFTTDDIAASAATPEELQAMYDRLAGRLYSQESVQVRFLTLPLGATPAADDKADAALWDTEAVRTPFLAREDSLPGIGAAPALTEAIFALKAAGEKTAWLEHDGKQYRFELIEHRDQTPMSFDDAKKVLEEMVAKEKAFRTVMEKASGFHQTLKNSDWSKAVSAEKLELQKIPAYLPGDYIDKIGKLKSVSGTLAELKAGDVSTTIPTSNGLAIFKVVSQSAPDAKLFDEKKSDLEKDLRLRHEMEVFSKTLQGLQSNLTVNTEVLAKLFPSKYAAESPASAPVSAK